jgi:hypothetical protein
MEILANMNLTNLDGPLNIARLPRADREPIEKSSENLRAFNMIIGRNSDARLPLTAHRHRLTNAGHNVC